MKNPGVEDQFNPFDANALEGFGLIAEEDGRQQAWEALLSGVQVTFG